ncbi:MAG: sodium/glutamate symporter [Candidatus Aminicenantia bacterium]
MEIKEINGVLTLGLGIIQTTALSIFVLFLGYFLKSKWSLLDKFNIPAPVVGGLTFAILVLFLRQTKIFAFELNTVLQTPFMIAFFTTVGLTASFFLLKKGGPQVLTFWGLASLLAFFQDLIGVFLSKLMGVNQYLGLICGSVTMTGGHGTGLAFGPEFEKLGMMGATSYTVAAATFGLVSGGLLGGPVGTFLIKKRHLKSKRVSQIGKKEIVESIDEFAEEKEKKIGLSAYEFLKYMAIILFCMWIGSIISQGFERLKITLPAYIGSMIFASIFRNLCDFSKLLKISQKYVEFFGSISLSIFLSMALMSLRLWELFELALPMLAILIVEVTLMAFFAVFVTFNVMGKDYESAVMSAGHCGFGLGATPNAIANMEAITEKFGPAPRAFLVIPLVGAFFIDFTNALIITTFINILK